MAALLSPVYRHDGPSDSHRPSSNPYPTARRSSPATVRFRAGCRETPGGVHFRRAALRPVAPGLCIESKQGLPGRKKRR